MPAAPRTEITERQGGEVTSGLFWLGEAVAPLLVTLLLRADVCKYQPEVCNSEKFKILKKIHNIAHGKLLQEIHVLLRSDNYF